GLSSLLLMMRAAVAVHTSQMKTLGPATSFATWDSSLPQKEQRSFRPNIASTSFEFEHHALHAGPHVVRMKTKLGGHSQHTGVFGQHVAIHAPQPFFPGVVDDALHEQPAEPVALESRANQDREFRGLLVELVLQPHQAEHATGALVEREESHFVPVVEMRKLLQLLGDQLGSAPKEAEPQIFRVDIAYKILVQRGVSRLRAADEHMLAAAGGLVQFVIIQAATRPATRPDARAWRPATGRSANVRTRADSRA